MNENTRRGFLKTLAGLFAGCPLGGSSAAAIESRWLAAGLDCKIPKLVCGIDGTGPTPRPLILDAISLREVPITEISPLTFDESAINVPCFHRDDPLFGESAWYGSSLKTCSRERLA